MAQKPENRSAGSRHAPPSTGLRALWTSIPFAFRILLLLILAAFLLNEHLYLNVWGLDLEKSRLIVLTLRCLTFWTLAALLSLWVVRLSVRRRGNPGRQDSARVHAFARIAAPSICLFLLTVVFHTPQTTYDLARYYAAGRVTEQRIAIVSTEEICRSGTRNTYCTLYVDLADGSRFGVNGVLSDLIKHRPDIEAVRRLPLSERIIGLRTKDGWL